MMITNENGTHGVVHSFITLLERQAILELADQILFNLFSRTGVIGLLRTLAADSGQ